MRRDIVCSAAYAVQSALKYLSKTFNATLGVGIFAPSAYSK